MKIKVRICYIFLFLLYKSNNITFSLIKLSKLLLPLSIIEPNLFGLYISLLVKGYQNSCFLLML